MAAPAAAKKKPKKGKTLTLTDFLAEDGGGGGGPTYIPKPVSWADETDDLEVSTTWHSNDDDVYRAPPIDRSILPTAPRAAREPNIDRSRLPKSPPYTAFLGNLPYDVTEESIKDFFRGLNISAVRLPREPTNPERLKGFGYAEFEDIDSLFQALSLNEESLGNRRIRVDVADQAQDKDRDDRCFGRDRDRFRDSERFESDWRARPAAPDAFDDFPPRRSDDGFGDRYRDRYDDRYRDGPRRDMDRGFGSRDRYDDRSRDYDRGYDSRIGSGRRAFGSGYRRDDDYRGYEDRYDRRDDRMDRWNSRDDYGRDDFRREDRGPTQRPKLNLKPRSAPKEEETSGAPAAQSSRAASIFGGAKPVDTAAREREVEERLQKEQEKLQRQLEDDKRIDRRPRERHPSWRSEENQERSRTGSESSQSGPAGPPGTSAGSGPTGRTTRRRESEKSLENEPLGKEEEPPSPPPKSREEKPKVMPAPPPKENAWMKRSSQNPPGNSQSSDSEQPSPTSGGPPGSSQPGDDGRTPQRREEPKPEGGRESSSKGRSCSRGPPGMGDPERRDPRKEHEPKKLEETPPSFSHEQSETPFGEGCDPPFWGA
ncbi:eukaryotic translation initiation factor 4B isoform X2 [Corvus hawaiiensis]|uniref:eukaryotic translation initiation factor 4B isoform X2 n=1 Tax=Corvus moneduloides TaxID=1196302 RepID=UPI0013642F3B|nr:eukaryotic translation initiation factor 4B isoform X2 [Corvus moneduloides]XP_041876058.1 eukaryotic translation initiation factor 4B isoform X2 [Corvus kubaryi]XP_048184078.1 eukaryotic translation initiation factor 4B isoform X2 [Corvus hawaiiensis]